MGLARDAGTGTPAKEPLSLRELWKHSSLSYAQNRMIQARRFCAVLFSYKS
nr:MAG TPA: hypothetical protein [Caudoviricetes sp.]